MFPKKISQNVDIFARIHGNVFPWQPAIIGNKASFYQSIFQISLPWLHLSLHNACPRYLKSRRNLLYLYQSLCLFTVFDTSHTCAERQKAEDRYFATQDLARVGKDEGAEALQSV